MDLSEPASLAMPRGTAAVIRVLAGADDNFTIRELGRLSGVSHARAAQIVEMLARHGVVETEDRGRARLCRLNRHHLATPALEALVGLRGALSDHLRAEISSWHMQPRHASMFGSAARGDGGVESDIDILVVRRDDANHDLESWAEQLHSTAMGVRRATGNPLSWFDVSGHELRTAVAAHEPIVEQWRADSIHLGGLALSTLLKDIA